MIDYVNIMCLIDNLSDNQKQNFNVVINGVTVIPYNNILDYFKYNYSQYKSVHSKNSTEFTDHFTYYLLYKSAENERIYNALNDTYKVLDNYNRTETTTNETTNSVMSETPTIVTNYATTENNAEFNPTEKIESTGGKTSNSGTSTITSTVSGNIGVTTSQQMLQSEIDLRLRNNFCKMICEEFARGDFIIWQLLYT